MCSTKRCHKCSIEVKSQGMATCCQGSGYKSLCTTSTGEPESLTMLRHVELTISCHPFNAEEYMHAVLSLPGAAFVIWCWGWD